MWILGEAPDASLEKLGALFRRHGLTTADLDAWKAGRNDVQKAGACELRGVRRELARKEKALAEAVAIIVLQKKFRQSWGTRTTLRR